MYNEISIIETKEWQIMSNNYTNIETKLIHAGEPEPRIKGAVCIPIFQTAMYETEGGSGYFDIQYIRLNNTPNHRALHTKLAALENAEAALVTASGMAAITTSLLTLLSAGDHLLIQDCIYGGTHDFINSHFNAFGLSFDFVDGQDPWSWKDKIKPNTKALYVETLSNPLLQMADLKAVVSFARENGLVSLIDNTFATPVNFRPAEMGFDLSLHSCTKYLNGHSDIVGGAVIGRADLIEKITHKLSHLGGSMDPHACFLLHRGLKTLALRVRFQNASAQKIAEFLENHPVVKHVNYPGLPSYAFHSWAKEWLDGFGGMLSFEIKGGPDRAKQFMDNTSIPLIAPSLGGVETLLTRPAATSHSGMSAENRARMGISDSLIRMSVGIESTEDIIADFKQALDTLT
jgi:cystathionine beta-lyase/cystathionine gamma-synthase